MDQKQARQVSRLLAVLTPKRRRSWVGLIVLLVMLALTLAHQQGGLKDLNQAAISNQPGLYQVIKFVDGDTIQVDMNGAPEIIRLVGVDTPETHKPNTPVQCYGPAAAAYTKRVIGQQRIRLVSDKLSTNRDRYDRLLRYVYLIDGTNFNQQLVSEGYGFYYPHFPFTLSNEFAAAQSKARTDRKGLWGQCKPKPTQNGGYESNPAGP